MMIMLLFQQNTFSHAKMVFVQKMFQKNVDIYAKMVCVQKIFQKKILFNELKKHDDNFNDDKKIYLSDHHLSHAASAIFPSPFEVDCIKS